MKVLVTGGAGFIASHIVDALIQREHSVAVIDDLSMGSRENLNPGARFHQVSIADAEAVESVFAEERPQLVCHHAAQTDVRRSMEDPAFDAAVNVLGTINLLQASARHRIERFLFASTSAVYSEPRYTPMDEDHPVAPQSAYGISKYSAEHYVKLYAGADDFRYKIFRYGNVYGPRQNPKGEAGVVAIFTGQLLTEVQPTIFGDGSKTRDYIFVGDVVQANVRAMSDAGDNQVYNISWAKEVSDCQIFESVRAAAGVNVDPKYASKRPGEADRVSLDRSKASKLLGWTPTVPLEQGIRQSVAYYADRHTKP